MWTDNIVSTIPATREYKEESVQYTANAPENPFKPIYVAHIAPHGPYGWSTGGTYDTQEKAEEAIRTQGWGGKVEKTTYYELHQVKI
jgi:hypothetical protein